MRFQPTARLAALLAAPIFGCAAPNPDRTIDLDGWDPPTTAKKEASEPDRDAPSEGSERRGSQPGPASTLDEVSAPIVVSSDPVVATVAGENVHISELLNLWLHRSAPELVDSLNNVVMARIVEAEARRLGVRLQPKEVEDAHALALESLRQRIQLEAPGMTIDEFVRERLMMNPEHYRARSRQYTIIALLMQNVVRSWLLANDYAFVRIAALPDEKKVAEFQMALEEGGDFEALARIYSIEPEDQRGQALAVVREEGFLGDVAFSTPAGEVAGPFEAAGSQILVLVVEKGEGSDTTWPLGEEKVRESFKRFEPGEYEYVHWRDEMQKRYRIDFSPFFDLLYGAPKAVE